LAAGLGVTLGARPAQAQMTLGQQEAPQPQGDLENWLVRNIMCQCGSCRHNLIECASENCGHAIQSRIQIHNLLAEGKGKEEVIQFFIQKYGSQVALASPIDKGFNRLAWALPYGAGLLAAAGLVVGARKLAKRTDARPALAGAPGEAGAAAAQDPDLADKLEDELRNLD
jgi:cytochrome c-type biogenesis protein CcmH/NrfF